MSRLKRHIFLIGMPGSGKSSLGKRVANALRLPYVDTDVLLIQTLKKDTKEILETYGETAFRNAETNLLAHLLSTQPCVISTGGGVPLKPVNQKMMVDNGFVILIDRPLEMIKSNIRIEKRPLLVQKGLDELDRIYNFRMPIYNKIAHYTLHNTGNMHEALRKLEHVMRSQMQV